MKKEDVISAIFDKSVSLSEFEDILKQFTFEQIEDLCDILTHTLEARISR